MNPPSIRPIVSIQTDSHRRLHYQLAHYFHSNQAIFFLRLLSGGGFLALAIGFLYIYLNQDRTLMNPESRNYLFGSYVCFTITFLWWWGVESLLWMGKALLQLCKKRKVRVPRVRFQRVVQVIEIEQTSEIQV